MLEKARGIDGRVHPGRLRRRAAESYDDLRDTKVSCPWLPYIVREMAFAIPKAAHVLLEVPGQGGSGSRCPILEPEGSILVRPRGSIWKVGQVEKRLSSCVDMIMQMCGKLGESMFIIVPLPMDAITSACF